MITDLDIQLAEQTRRAEVAEARAARLTSLLATSPSLAQTPDLIASFDGMSVYRNKDDIGLFFDRSNEGAVSVRISDDVAKELARSVSAALAPGNTDEQMARLSASEVACYRWPEDTAEHRAMRAAFMDGVALADGNAVQTSDLEKELEKLKFGIAEIALVVGWTDVKGKSVLEMVKDAVRQTALAPGNAGAMEAGDAHHKLDNDQQVFFYEQDFYVLSNFSAFSLRWAGDIFPTSEHVYHWEKFRPAVYETFELQALAVRNEIKAALSAHEAFKIAERNKILRRSNWDDIKVNMMRNILIKKVEQHEYVRRKLLATGDRELIEDSWRDDFWGWGPNRDGKNMLGKLWMEIRAELRAAPLPATQGEGQ